jgi:hypothetical protein
MTRDDATALAVKIHQTWPRGLNAEIWEEELADYHTGPAGTAYVRLRRTSSRPPSIAEFHAEYCTHLDHQPGPEHPDCPVCDNTGTKPVTDHRRHRTGCTSTAPVDHKDDCHCHAIEPCHCPWGTNTATIITRIHAHNTRELDRTRGARSPSALSPSI